MIIINNALPVSNRPGVSTIRICLPNLSAFSRLHIFVTEEFEASE